MSKDPNKEVERAANLRVYSEILKLQQQTTEQMLELLDIIKKSADDYEMLRKNLFSLKVMEKEVKAKI